MCVCVCVCACVCVCVCVSVSIMPSISLSVHNVFLDAKREWVCASLHMTEDYNLVEIMKDRFFPPCNGSYVGYMEV